MKLRLNSVLCSLLKISRQGGFNLIELMVVIAIIGGGSLTGKIIIDSFSSIGSTNTSTGEFQWSFPR